MGMTKVFRHSFAGGEVAPELEARIDDNKHQQGVATCKNMVVHAQGFLERRRGSELVVENANNALSRLITFDFSADQQLCIEIAAGKFRFHVDGAPVLAADTAFVFTQTVTGTNLTPGLMLLNYNLPGHGLQTGDAFTLGFAPGGAVPTPLALFTVYYAIAVDATHIQVATTRENALAGVFVNMTTTGSLIRTHRVYEVGESVGYPSAGGTAYICSVRSLAGYIPPTIAAASCTFDAATERVVQPNHGLFQGAPVQFQLGTGTLPPELTAGVVYYALPVNANEYQVSATYGPGPAITFSGPGTAGTTSTRQQLWTVAPNGIYEVPNSYAQADLMDLKHAQSNDVVRLTHPDYPESELRRFAATFWSFGPVSYLANIDVPTTLSPLVDEGVTIGISSVDTSSLSPGYIVFQTPSDHLLSIGDVVLWDGGGDVQNSPPTSTYDGNGEFFIVATVVDELKFALKELDGTRVDLTSGTNHIVSGSIYFRRTSLLAPQEHSYQITAIDDAGRETLPSATITATNQLDVEGATNTVRWSPVTGAVRYRVYKDRNGIFGLLGEVEHDPALSQYAFVDDTTFTPDLKVTAPKQSDRLGNGDYARSSAFFEERWWVGGTRSRAQTLFSTRTGTNGDMTYHIPVLATDRIERTIADTQAQTIRHLVPLGNLVVLTNGAEYRVTSENGAAVTPENIANRRQATVGASDVTPVVVNNTILFAAARGGHLWELGYNDQAGGYVPGDVCLRALHLFDDFEPLDLAYAKARVQSAWVCSSSGKLLGLTYMPAEQIGAWHQHSSVAAAFRSVCVVTEDGYDSIYLSVERDLGSGTQHFIERIRLLPRPAAIADGHYVDCGLAYTNTSGSTETVIAGLDHLIGETVVALVDVTVQRDLVVNGSGEVTLSPGLADGKTVRIGLGMQAQVRTLPLAFGSDGAYAQGRTKNVQRVGAKVRGTARFQIGVEDATMVDTAEIAAGALADGLVRSLQIGKWKDGGQIVLQQDDPLPMNLDGLVLDVSYGGP